MQRQSAIKCPSTITNGHALYLWNGHAFHYGTWGVARVVSTPESFEKYMQHGYKAIAYEHLPTPIQSAINKRR